MATLDPALQRWLDRLADIYDQWCLHPDMRPVGEVVADVVRQVATLSNGPAPVADESRHQRD